MKRSPSLLVAAALLGALAFAQPAPATDDSFTARACGAAPESLRAHTPSSATLEPCGPHLERVAVLESLRAHTPNTATLEPFAQPFSQKAELNVRR